MNRELIYSWYEQYKNGLYRYAFSILKDTHLAEDVLQEVFVKLLSGKGFPNPGKEQAWLYRVARNVCYDHLRKTRREQREEPNAAHQEPGYEYIELIAGLPKKEQEIVTLKIVGGLSHREIAVVFGISVQAAKKRYERAIQKLREE